MKKLERFEWVNELRNKILNKIHSQNQNPIPLTIVMSEQEKIQQLEKQLTLSKAEAARWFVKYEEKVRELRLMKEGLERQMNIRS